MKSAHFHEHTACRPALAPIRKALFTLGFLTVSVIALTGCQQQEEMTLDEVQKSLSKTLDQAGKTLGEITERSRRVPDIAQSEVEKIVSFEYRVMKISKTDEPELMEAELAALGEQRWDCFHVEPQGLDLLFFCKRRPKSYLRYALRAW